MRNSPRDRILTARLAKPTKLSRLRSPVVLVGVWLIFVAPAHSDPVLDYGNLFVVSRGSSHYIAGSITDAFSFTTDGVSDFSGGSDATDAEVTFNGFSSTPAFCCFYANGQISLERISESEEAFDYNQFGTYTAQSHTYTVSANLLHGADQPYQSGGLDDTYQFRSHYEFDFDIEIRWHLTSRGIEPKLRLASGVAFTTAFACQKLAGVQGGCPSSSPGTNNGTATVDYTVNIARLSGSGEWVLQLSIGRTGGVQSISSNYTFPLLGYQREVPRGSLSVSIENETPCCAKTSIDEATITLIRQSDFLRPQGPSESPTDYQDYLDARTTFAVESRNIATGSNGVLTFDNLPLYGLGRRSASVPLWYAIRISAAQTEEIDIEQDPPNPSITATTFFIPETNINLSPSTLETPPVEHYLITPTDAIGAKLVLIPDVRKNCMTQYKDAEDTMQAGLDAYLASPGATTAANFEGVKRALWAERVVRAASDYSDEAVTVALAGLATVAGDIYDDATNPKRADLKKRTDELEAMNARSGIKPVEFYSDLGLDNAQTLEAMTLDNILLEGEVAGVIKGTIKVLKQSFVERCIEVGGEADDCEADAGAMTLAMVTVLNSISTRTIHGAAKSGIKAAIEGSVKLAKGPLFDHYCSNTAPHLATAVASGLAWPTVDEDDYRDDAGDVVDILRELSLVAQRTGRAEAIQIAAGGLDRAGDAAELLSAVSGKQLKAFELILKVSKYVYNVASIIMPMTVISHAQADVEKGTLAAYGQVPLPASARASRLLVASGSHSSGGAAIAALTSRATSLRAAEFAIRLPLGNDDFPAAIQAAADTADTDAYVNHLAAWTLEVEQFKAIVTAIQASGLGTVADLISSFMIADADLKLAHATMLASLRELFVAIDTVTYASPSSGDYLVHRNSLIAQLISIRSKIEAASDAAWALDAALDGQPMTPFIFARVTSFASADTGKKQITQSPEEFALSVEFENLSVTELSGLEARLVVDSPKESITLISSSDAVIGVLAGGERTTVDWSFDYDGDLSDEVVDLRVELFENDEIPSSFEFNGPHTNVFVDPAISDQDGDDMPDDWEVLHGLDPTVDDSAIDSDLDDLTNLAEYYYGLIPSNPDSDDDNIPDGDELFGLRNGFITDPLDADSDGDLVNDDLDGQPLDPSTSAPGPAALLGQLQLSTNTVELSSTNLFETVDVTNVGPGSMAWSTTVDNDAVALVTPRGQNMITDDGGIGISVPHNFDFDQAYLTETTVHVRDVEYPKNNPREISVVIRGDLVPEPSQIELAFAALVTLMLLARRRKSAGYAS